MNGTVKQDRIDIGNLPAKRRYPPMPDLLEELLLSQINHRTDVVEITLYIFKAGTLLYYTMTVTRGQL